MQWFEAYDQADTEPIPVDMRQIHWTVCCSSPQKRAVQTAREIYNGEISLHDELMELDASPFLRPGIRLPFLVWGIWIRWKTMSDHPATKIFKEKIGHFVDTLSGYESDDVLIVSHGLVMTFLREELLKRGFSGESFRGPAYGRIYIFEK